MKHGSGALATVALLAAAVGFAGGWLAREIPDAPVAPPPQTRSALVEEAIPSPAPAPSDSPVASEEPARPVPSPRREGAPRIEASAPAPEPAPERPTSQEDLLASVGFNAGAALGLRQRSERFVQARAYLSKESEREESAASLELARSQKQEIGEEAYSYMLWSAGIPNRVAVNEVVPESSASRIGIQRG